MEKIRERFKQNQSSCESVRLRKRSSILYSTDDRRPQTLGVFATCFPGTAGCICRREAVPPRPAVGNPRCSQMDMFLSAVFMVHLVLLQSDSDQHHGNGSDHPGTLLLPVTRLQNAQQLEVFVSGVLGRSHPSHSSDRLASSAVLSFLCGTEQAEAHHTAMHSHCVHVAFVFTCSLDTSNNLLGNECFHHLCRTLALAISTLIDSVFYGKWNFLKFNVLHNVAEFYGAHPWHWYFTQGLLVVIGPHLPFFMHGCSLATKKHRILLITILWTTAIYSFLAHKELRFIYPVLPFCMIFCGISLAKLQAWRKTAAGALLVLNLCPALYTGLIHQRGTLDVMHDLQRLCDISDSQNSTELLFLMPCHSTPLYSHLHCPLKLRFLECPPDLTGNEEYMDEAAVFFSNPLHWLRTSFPSQSTLPSHIVLFDFLQKEIAAFLEENRFTKQAEIFHTHFPEGRVGSKILIYTRVSGLKIDSFL
ncbi:GPI alpha-1,2-mannosyltransferase 3 isoform X5 [Siphateles boraxobius]|uniref:GPI alpha-1,2-mannosyltransferase 3 isoform X5 n=1 Tax=Siphateles boraxobius TaxID=180520 RepID=UPI004063ECB8